MFASAPLMPYMKASLDLTKPQIGSGNIAAVSTNIVMRVIVGYLSDVLGPRRSLAFLLLITTPAIVGMMCAPAPRAVFHPRRLTTTLTRVVVPGW